MSTYDLNCQSCGKAFRNNRFACYCQRCRKNKKQVGTTIPITTYQKILQKNDSVSMFVVHAINAYLDRGIPPVENKLCNDEQRIFTVIKDVGNISWEELLSVVKDRRSVIRKCVLKLMKNGWISSNHEEGTFSLYENPTLFVKKRDENRLLISRENENKAIFVAIPHFLYDIVTNIATMRDTNISHVLRDAVQSII